MNPAQKNIPHKVDSLWLNVQVATMTPTGPYGMIRDAALAIRGDKVAWIGERADLPADFESRADEVHDGKSCWITPGLVDCHTHLVYAGNRAGEFEMRLQGASYEDIARQGGGIRSTVAATRAADEQSLMDQSSSRLLSLMAEGVTTVEIKSGYGLDLETELRMLRVARKLGKKYPVTVVPTYLGAHALPPEYDGRGDDYIGFVCQTVMPEVAAQKLAGSVDVFCESIGFTPEQTEQVFQTAKKLGLTVKLHAEQLSDLQGAQLAARYQALSAEHLEYVSEEGIKAMAASGTVAVLLPGAFYFLKETRVPPIDYLRRHRVPIALATDCNPGSSPTTSLLLMLNMACTLFGMTPEEALAGVTRNGARALGLQDRIGTLEPGKDADFVVWEISEPAELSYRIGFNPLKQVVRRGKPVSALA
jgi:imidazolonepropionase